MAKIALAEYLKTADTLVLEIWNLPYVLDRQAKGPMETWQAWYSAVCAAFSVFTLEVFPFTLLERTDFRQSSPPFISGTASQAPSKGMAAVIAGICKGRAEGTLFWGDTSDNSNVKRALQTEVGAP